MVLFTFGATPGHVVVCSLLHLIRCVQLIGIHGLLVGVSEMGSLFFIHQIIFIYLVIYGAGSYLSGKLGDKYGRRG